MSLSTIKFTRVERMMLDLLADGLPHNRRQLMDLIPHGQGDRNNVNVWLTHIRKKLRPVGHDIICEWKNRGVYYRHVILLSAHDE